MPEYKPWKGDKLDDAVKSSRKTTEVSEGIEALRGIRESMGKVLKKDQALKISTYTPEKTERKEGERWEEDGKLWEMKDGTKQSVSKLQSAKRPWFCPKCGKVMNTRLDDKMWYKKGTCYDCVVKNETQMRLDGTWHKYQAKVLRANAIAWAKEKIEELESYKTMVGNPQIHFADGRWEEWNIGGEKIASDLQAEIDSLGKYVAELEELQAKVDK